MMRKRTITSILLVFLLAFCAFLARDPITSAFFEMYFKGYCRLCLGGQLSYQDIHRDGNHWIFDAPTLTSNKKLADGGFHFAAETIALNASLDLLSRTIDFKMKLDSPHIEIGRGAEDLLKIIKQQYDEYRFFQVRSQFEIPKGSVLLDLMPGEEAIPLYFDLDSSCLNHHEGCASIWLDNGKSKLTASISSLSQEQAELELNFDNFDAVTLFRIISKIWTQYSTLNCQNGTVNGKVVVTIPQERTSYAEGLLKIGNMEIAYPEIESKLYVPEATLDLLPQRVNHRYQTIGVVKTTPQSSLHFYKGHVPYWIIDNLESTFTFKGADRAIFDIFGNCEVEGSRRELKIKGEARFATPGQEKISVAIHVLGGEKQHDVAVHFSARELGDEWRFGELELSGIGKGEFDFFQHVAGSRFPALKKMHMHDGTIDLSMLVYLQGLNLSEVKVERVTANKLEIDFDALKLQLGAKDASGFLSFDLSTDSPLETLNADLNIAQGMIKFTGFDQSQLHFGNIYTRLKIRQGIVQKSILKGTVAGLEGEIEIEGTSSGPIIALNFAGKMRDFSQILPEHIKNDVDAQYANEHLQINSTVVNCEEGISLNGKFILQGEDDVKDEMAFGFTVDKLSSIQLEDTPSQIQEKSYSSEDGAELISALMPAFESSDNLPLKEVIKSKVGTIGFVIKDGWFSSANVRLEKYLSPFLFRKQQMTLSGIGDFKGTFDTFGCDVVYDLQKLSLENKDFAIEVSCCEEGIRTKKPMQGAYHFDLIKQQGQGTLDLHDGTYFEKNSGLFFTDFASKVSYGSAAAKFCDCEVFCNGIYFAGLIDVNWDKPGEGVFEVDIHADKMHGMISQAQNIFAHFTKSSFLINLPMEGELEFHRNGGLFHFAFEPNSFAFEAHAEGTVSDAKLTNETADVMLQEVAMNFEYDHSANTLDFSDIQGTLLVGNPKSMEEYNIAGDWLRFTDYMHNQTEFDLWVGDKKRDIIRIAGKTHSHIDENGHELIDFEFDNAASHFGDVHPSASILTLKDWSQIYNCKLDFSFSLKTLLADLQRFSRTGLFFLSRNILKQLNSINEAGGNFKASFGYDNDRAVFTYNIVGDQVAFGDYQFHKFLFQGNKKGSVWTIDQLQLDDISFALDLLKEENIWNINFLGARFGKSLLLGLDGKFNSENDVLDARVNLLEVNLAHLDGWSAFQKPLEGLGFEGHLNDMGKLKIKLECEPFLFKVEAQCMHQRQQFGLELRSFTPRLNSGELLIFTRNSQVPFANQPIPLTIIWQIDAQNGVYIDKVDGSLCGLSFDLVRDSKHALAFDNLFLTGKVDVDFNKAKVLMEDSLVEKIDAWQIGKGYSLQGMWNLNKDSEKKLLGSIAFTGDLLGDHFELQGYQFSRLLAHCALCSDEVKMSRLVISDQCGNLHADELKCLKGREDIWTIAIPHAVLKDFRPSMLNEINSTTPQATRPLVINPIALHDFKGILGDSNSFTGYGKLSFSNPPKKNLQHTIFAIPAEILTRIGLDLDVLTPVKGDVEYQIKEGKVFLTHFNDVYSKKKASKFYLSDHHQPSYIDFDGNLNLQVRMKQYNLIFKLAELFTVTVQGTLGKPTYTLQKQNHDD